MVGEERRKGRIEGGRQGQKERAGEGRGGRTEGRVGKEKGQRGEEGRRENKRGKREGGWGNFIIK